MVVLQDKKQNERQKPHRQVPLIQTIDHRRGLINHADDEVPVRYVLELSLLLSIHGKQFLTPHKTATSTGQGIVAVSSFKSETLDVTFCTVRFLTSRLDTFATSRENSIELCNLLRPLGVSY